MKTNLLFRDCESALAYAKERVDAKDYESAQGLLTTALIRVRNLMSIVNREVKQNKLQSQPTFKDLS